MMALELIEVVDTIGIEKESGTVILTLIDQQHFEDESEHLLLLQEKLNRYLAFIESGEILDSYPKAKGRASAIEIVFRYAPPERAQGFLKQVESIMAGAGVGFCWRVYAEQSQ